MSNVLAEQATRSSEAGVGPADERPLTDQERKVVARLLADPFAFPQSFKTWLIAFLEGSDLSLPLASVMGLGTLLGLQGGGGAGVFGILPAGMLFPVAVDVAPPGTLMCNGAAYQRVGTYERLFKAIGIKWGAGDGSSTFNVPDYQNRMLVGIGPGYALAATDGLASINRGPKHHHIGALHSHGHSHTHTLFHTHGYERPYNTGAAVAAGSDRYAYSAQAGTTGYGDESTTSGPNFPNTSPAGNDVTTGGGPLDAPSYAVCGVVINY